MPYCQDCGSHFENEAGACKSCGAEIPVNGGTNHSTAEKNIGNEPLKDAGDITTPKKGRGDDPKQPATSLMDEATKASDEASETMKSNNNPVFEKIMDDFMRQESLSLGTHRNQIESHLGKGLIKPVAIENCMDGYHFKYDEPPRQINKADPQNEKVVEFRVSGEPELGNVNKEIDEVKVETNESEAKDITVEIELKEDNQVALEPDREAEAGPEEVSPDVAETNFLQDEAEVTPEQETNSEADEGDPELVEVISPEVVWEGRRTWYGLPLNEFYRLTDQGAIVLKEDDSKFKEVVWETVSEIRINQNWLTRLLNLGNLVITGLNSEPLLVLEGIENPERIRERLVEILGSKI
jgi:hypothetical protein